MAGILDSGVDSAQKVPATTTAQSGGEANLRLPLMRWMPPSYFWVSMLVGAAIGAALFAAIGRGERVPLASVLLWSNHEEVLRWLVALLPGSIIVLQAYYLMSSRRQQFQMSLGRADSNRTQELVELYFGTTSLLVRYMVPAVLVTVLCYFAAAAITRPDVYLAWLYTAGSGGMPLPSGWPNRPWANDVLRGAAFAFAGAYTYLVLLLTERAFRRDVTTGTAVWAAAMPVVGPLLGGAAALFLSTTLPTSEVSFTRDAALFVVGMLPRQFATFVQSGVRKMFQSGSAPTAVRTVPLTVLRGIGPAVESRLEEEGIHDVSSLAFRSPHQLIRATTYSPRQIVDWIDEALLVTNAPDHWTAFEKAGVTGAIDLAWYHDREESLKVLAEEVRMQPRLLKDLAERLYVDAQVSDLCGLYWDGVTRPAIAGPNAPQRTACDAPPPTNPSEDSADTVSLQYQFAEGIQQEARERLLAELKSWPGVTDAKVSPPNALHVTVRSSDRDATETKLRNKAEVEPPLIVTEVLASEPDANGKITVTIVGHALRVGATLAVTDAVLPTPLVPVGDSNDRFTAVVDRWPASSADVRITLAQRSTTFHWTPQSATTDKRDTADTSGTAANESGIQDADAVTDTTNHVNEPS